MQGARNHTVAERLTFTIDEVARALGIGRNSAFAAAHRGEIPFIKIGRRLLVPKVAFEKMLDNCVSRSPATEDRGAIVDERKAGVSREEI